jgi:hypothetical protein
MNTKSKITLVAAVLTSLAAPAFANAVPEEFRGQLTRPAQALSYEGNAAQSYASSRSQWTPAVSNAAPIRSWEEQRAFDRQSGVTY